MAAPARLRLRQIDHLHGRFAGHLSVSSFSGCRNILCQRPISAILLILALSLQISTARADGSTIGKIYEPYVQPLEKELEYMALYEDENAVFKDKLMSHQLSLGTAVSEHWAVEGATTYAGSPYSGVDKYELELRRQLTEQGEYDSDWGMMAGIEKDRTRDAWEVSMGLLNTKEWRRWQFTSNLFLIREWGKKINSEYEGSFSFQGKYRYSAAFEPGLEMFLSEDTRAFGPMLTGQFQLAAPNKLLWQASVLIGTKKTTPDETVKFQLEYEFF